MRPTHEGYDTDVVLRDLGGGAYGAEVELALEGQWDVRLWISRQGDVYQLVQRLHVR